MIRRCWIVVALLLWSGASGCTGTMRRADGPLSGSPRTWAEAPAPPQQQVALPPERLQTPDGSPTSPLGLAKYFPGLRRDPADAPKAASTAPTSWFSFNRRPKATQFYTTDARAGLNQGMAEASALPVSLQVPSDRAADAAVTPAKAEQTSGGSDLAPPAPVIAAETQSATAPAASATLAPSAAVGSSPSATVLPEPESRAVAVNRMPDLPAVDPRERPRLTSPAASEAPADSRKSDDQARKAVPDAATSPDQPEPTILAAFLHRIGVKAYGTPQAYPTTILASPQSAPSPQVAPKPKHKSKPKVVLPTSQARPSSQAEESSNGCVCSNCGAKICKKPCILKRIKTAIINCKGKGDPKP